MKHYVSHDEKAKEDLNKKERKQTPSKRESITNVKAVVEKKDINISANNDDLKTVDRAAKDKLNPHMMYLNISCDKASNIGSSKPSPITLK